MSPPDADVHPVATGRAKKTVDRNSAEQPLKLYSGWFCPFVQRVWLVLEEKGIPYQYVEVNPYHKPASLMKSNPRGLVPTLEIAPGKSLYESSVLLEYLEETYPDHGLRILPQDSFLRAKARIWADFVTTRVVPAFHRLLQFQPGETEGGKERLDQLRGEFRSVLLEFAKEMIKMDGEAGGSYFMGNEPGLVDFMLGPHAVRLWVFEHFKGGLRIPEPGKGGEDEKAWARWRKWYDAMNNRESVKVTTSDLEHYLPIYQRYADDTAQSELAKATRAGRGVP